METSCVDWSAVNALKRRLTIYYEVSLYRALVI